MMFTAGPGASDLQPWRHLFVVATHVTLAGGFRRKKGTERRSLFAGKLGALFLGSDRVNGVCTRQIFPSSVYSAKGRAASILSFVFQCAS